MKLTGLQIYFIIAYIISIPLIVFLVNDIIQQPLVDKWEIADCPVSGNSDYRVVSTETICEKHISYTNQDKIIGTVLTIFLILMLPFMILFVYPMVKITYEI